MKTHCRRYLCVASPRGNRPMELIIGPPQPALSRVKGTERSPIRVALLQTHWHEDTAQHSAALLAGIRMASDNGARMVFLPELTLSRYPADVLPHGTQRKRAEHVDGETYEFAKLAAQSNNVFVQASFYEHAPELGDGRGFNTAILVSPDGDMVGRTRKLHIPVTAGYYEDKYFAQGPANDPYPVHTVEVPGVGGTLHLGTNSEKSDVQ